MERKLTFKHLHVSPAELATCYAHMMRRKGVLERGRKRAIRLRAFARIETELAHQGVQDAAVARRDSLLEED